MIFRGWKVTLRGAAYQAAEVTVTAFADRGLEDNPLTGNVIMGGLDDIRAYMVGLDLQPTSTTIIEAGVVEFWW